MLLASTFRSGSTFVAALLKANGLEGLNWEKFNDIWRCVSASDDEFYNACLKVARTTRDGVFASKIMWPQRNKLAKCVQTDRKHSSELANAFPASKWIFVYRENKIKQSISFWRAKKSGRWHVNAVETEPVIEYNYKEIRKCYNEFVAYDQLWDDFFTQASIVPFRIKYEDFQSNLETQLTNLLDFIGEYRKNHLPFTTVCELKRQSDPLSADYYERFLEDSYTFT